MLVEKIVRLRRFCSYALVAPFSLMLVGLAILSRRLVEVRFDLVPVRFGTLILYALEDLRLRGEPRMQLNARRHIRFAGPELPNYNRELYSWLSGLAGWVRLPRPVIVVAVQICRFFPSSKTMIRQSPTYEEAVNLYFNCPRLKVPESALRLASEMRASVGALRNEFVLMLIVREASDYASKMAWRRGLEHVAISHARGNLFRNCSISNYRCAIEAVASSGVSVVRVGNFIETPAEFKSKNYWEYASSNFNSHLGDLAVSSLADAVVSCSNGLDLLYHVQGKPVIGVNVPWIDAAYRWHHMILPKHLFIQDGDEQIDLPLVALASRACTWRGGYPYYDNLRIQFRENSPVEIEETFLLAMKTVRNKSDYQSEIQKCQPFWVEFWSRAKSGNMIAYQRQSEPVILVPPSVLNRFFEAQN